MRSMTATTTSTDSADGAHGRPRIGLLGIMQSLYDAMLPGIADRQAAYAQEVADALADVADVMVAPPVKERADAERVMREFAGSDLDGLLVVMLTYGPAMRVARLLAETKLPICLANIQPVAAVTAEWDMGDLTYNQGIHGAQDTANAMVRAGRSFHVITDDWHQPSFVDAVGAWARAAAAVTRWKALKVAVFGYAMNGMGDIRVDAHALIRSLGPQIDALAPGDLVRAAAAVTDAEVAELIAAEDAQFEIDPALSQEERTDHVRMQIGLENLLRAGGYGAYSTHFDAIGEDGRFHRLPLAEALGHQAGGGGARPARDHAVHRDVRDGLPERLDPDEPHGRGQLGARASGPARPPDQAPARDRGARGPADVPVPVRDRPVHAGHADLARRREVPAARGRGRDPRHRGAAGARDALRLLPPGQRPARLHERVAEARRSASPGAQPRPRGRGLADLLRARGD